MYFDHIFSSAEMIDDNRNRVALTKFSEDVIAEKGYE